MGGKLELHPSPTARTGHLPSEAVSHGPNADVGPYSANKDVYCRQCGFPCNLDRDARNIDEFIGETITSGNILTNGSFESWTGGNPDSWTLSGSVTQVTTAGYFDPSDDGTSSARIIKTSSTISLSQTPSTPSDFNGNIVTFRARIKSLTNGVVRLRLTINGTAYYSDYNTAQQRFRDLVVTRICPATVSSLSVAVLADDASGTAYVDQCILARNGNPTVVDVVAGCKHCGSYNYA